MGENPKTEQHQLGDLRLNNWLFKKTMVLGIWRVTVPYTLHILGIPLREQHPAKRGSQGQGALSPDTY